MQNESLFLVEKGEYAAYVERLIPEKMDTEIIEDREFSIFKVKSRKTGIYLCGCKFYRDERPTEYYIFELPEKDEWTAAKPKLQVQLTEDESKQLWEELIKAKSANKPAT